jgi:hypothetical protein
VRQWLQVLLVAAPAYALIVVVSRLAPRLADVRVLHKPEEKT